MAETHFTPILYATGIGTVEVKPNVVRVTFSVMTNEDSPAKALSASLTAFNENEERLAAVGVQQADVQTESALSGYGYDGSATDRQFSALQKVTALVRDLDQLPMVYDTAFQTTDAGVTLTGTILGFSDPSQARNAARQAAVEDARANAEFLAAAAGLRLDKIVAIRETSQQNLSDRYDIIYASLNDQIAGGKLPVSVTVTVEYELIE